MTEQEFLVRIGLSMVCGGLLGLERQLTEHPAGLRTLILVCMGSTLIGSADVYLHTTFKTQDTFRLAAQVVTGVGFIGGGAILQTKAAVKGLTTAATLWMTAAVGLALGVGFYAAGIITTVLALFTLSILALIERHLPSTRLKRDKEAGDSGESNVKRK
ncbi:MgtC/SapB family protein [Candidatus Poribacteria bacterium]|nr:MgtC/SapB family protein [Candidatus Poribacteria bacterium]